jgi:hypothetical protein
MYLRTRPTANDSRAAGSCAEFCMLNARDQHPRGQMRLAFVIALEPMPILPVISAGSNEPLISKYAYHVSGLLITGFVNRKRDSASSQTDTSGRISVQEPIRLRKRSLIGPHSYRFAASQNLMPLGFTGARLCKTPRAESRSRNRFGSGSEASDGVALQSTVILPSERTK